MTVILKILELILVMGVLILVHEAGHFTFAKIFGIRVDKFYLFFDFGDKKLLSTKSGWFAKLFPKAKEWDTEYGIGWCPLGGYCKIAGMIDESMDTYYLKNEPQPWEFRSKPAWQRLFVMAGGVLFNFMLAIVVYAGILAGWGEQYLSNEGSRIYVNELAYDMGFRNGDHIISFDGYVPESFDMLQADLARHMTRKAVVERGGDTLSIYIDHSMIGDVLESPYMFTLARPFVVESVQKGSPNEESGLVKGDRIISIEGMPVPYVQEGWPVLEANAGKPVDVAVVRGEDTLAMQMQVDTSGRLGVLLAMPDNVRTREYTLASAVPAGFRKTFSTIGDYVRDLRLVATPGTGAYKQLGSFIAIGQAMPSQWSWYVILNYLALFSIMLAVMNLLPIPALDGGHIVFTLYEMVTGRKPSDRFLSVMQMIGMLLLFGLMFLACGNDIVRIFR
jgi:regulator of sigma E protease